MRAPVLQRPTVGILIAALLLTLATQHATATAVGARTDDTSKVTIFIHGYSGGDCEGDWGFLIDHMRAKGWTGSFYVPKFLSGDSSCNPRPGVAMGCMNCTGSHTYWFGHSGTTHSNNTSIRHLAWHLANYIATNFTAKGVVVDVVAHSMGGLMIRYALAKQGVDDFPRLKVEDVITLGSPHNGASFAALMGTTQGAEMEPSSTLIKWLKDWGMNPQGQGGTDWSVIGSHGDLIVQEDSATGDVGAAPMAVYDHAELDPPPRLHEELRRRIDAPRAIPVRLVARQLVRDLDVLPGPDDPGCHPGRGALAPGLGRPTWPPLMLQNERVRRARTRRRSR